MPEDRESVKLTVAHFFKMFFGKSNELKTYVYKINV